ncbi:MAG: hypothetical protein AVDCRST_MAG38-1237, partial [uncultured Solirubrobacteraceae bacterium]
WPRWTPGRRRQRDGVPQSNGGRAWWSSTGRTGIRATERRSSSAATTRTGTYSRLRCHRRSGVPVPTCTSTSSRTSTSTRASRSSASTARSERSSPGRRFTCLGRPGTSIRGTLDLAASSSVTRSRPIRHSSARTARPSSRGSSTAGSATPANWRRCISRSCSTPPAGRASPRGRSRYSARCCRCSRPSEGGAATRSNSRSP